MIKLFGVIIQLSPSTDQDIVSTTTSSEDTASCFLIKDLAQCERQESCKSDEDTGRAEAGTPETSSFNTKIQLLNTYDRGVSEETSSSDDKTMKKPDDKLLPCPRCSSMDTKFCYYNNYNVSQLRHLCKNCQRYWTAGGTMRIVPVGSGRRKNKCSLTSLYRRIHVSEAPPFAMIDVEEPQNSVSNGCLAQNDQIISFSYGAQQIGDDNSSGSSSTVLNHNEEVFYTSVESKLTNIEESPTQVPSFPVPAWASPWNTAEWMSATQPAFGSPEFPISVYSMPSYWGCPVPTPWKMPWLSLQCSSAQLSVCNPGPNSQTLGKHQRDGSMTGLSEPEKEDLQKKKLKGLGLTPKTLRIHDATEPAQSCIWSTTMNT